MTSQAPPKSRVQLVESTPQRAVLIIPPGGKRARSMGCFAFMWLAIVGTITSVFVTAQLGGPANGNAPPGWVMILFAGVFWGVGIGMAYAWMRMRFTRYLIAAEPHQLSVQRQFFGKKKTSITALDGNSIAKLKESYSENDVPVYCIHVVGTDDDEKFGTALDLPEKQWIVDTINKVIHPTAKRAAASFSDDPYCDECGIQLLESSLGMVCPDCGKIFKDDDLDRLDDDSESDEIEDIGETVEPLNPMDLPSDSRIRIVSETEDGLVVSYPIINSTAAKLMIGGVFTCIGLAWSGYAASFLFEKNGFQPVAFVISLAFFLGGLAPLAIGFVIWFGRVKISVLRDVVSGRAGFGPIGFGRSVATDSIERVALSSTLLRQKMNSEGRMPEQIGKHKACTIFSSEHSFPLTTGMNRAVDTQMCGLVLFQLTRMGYSI